MISVFSSWRWLAFLVAAAALAPWLLGGGGAPILPASIGPLMLRQSVSGAEAAELVNRMHGRRVAEASNAIGYYGSGRGEAVLYVTLFEGVAEARKAESGMGAKISTGEYPFRGYREGTVDGKRVAGCSGLGKAHFIFSHGRSLYWLAVHPPLAEVALRDLLASLP